MDTISLYVCWKLQLFQLILVTCLGGADTEVSGSQQCVDQLEDITYDHTDKMWLVFADVPASKLLSFKYRNMEAMLQSLPGPAALFIEHCTYTQTEIKNVHDLPTTNYVRKKSVCAKALLSNVDMTIYDLQYRMYSSVSLTVSEYFWINITFLHFEMDPLDDEFGDCKFDFGLQSMYILRDACFSENYCGTKRPFSVVIPSNFVLLTDNNIYRSHSAYFILFQYQIMEQNIRHLAPTMMKKFFLQPRILRISFQLHVNAIRRIWLVKTLIGHHLRLQVVRCQFDLVYICDGPMRARCAIFDYGCPNRVPFETQYFVSYIEVNDTGTNFNLSLSCRYSTKSNPIMTGNMRHFHVNTTGVPIFQRSWQISVRLLPVEIFFSSQRKFSGITEKNCLYGGTRCKMYLLYYNRVRVRVQPINSNHSPIQPIIHPTIQLPDHPPI